MQSLSLYIHFPFCEHLCNYCDFYKKKQNQQDLVAKNKEITDFEGLLDDSIRIHNEQLAPFDFSTMTFQTIFIGGGTPSLWGQSGLRWLESKKIKLTSNYEWTMEANPNSFTKSLAQDYAALGVNRWSLGVQSMNPSLLPLLDRIHSPNQVLESLDILSSLYPKPRVSVDFMLGIPQHKRDVIAEIAQILKYPIVTHLSVYILTTKKNYINEHLKPSEEQIQKEYLEVAEFLKSQGFIHYEVSNFAKSPRDFSLHNLAYWQHKTVFALGISGTGLIHEQHENIVKSTRYKWLANNQLDIEVLNHQQRQLENLYLLIRLHTGVELHEHILSKYWTKLDEKIQCWHTNKWIFNKSSHIQLTSLGFLFMDSLMDDILPLLE